MDKSFTIICNKCGKSSVLSNKIDCIEDFDEFEISEYQSIDISGTMNETAEISCVCGNIIERL